MIYETPELTDSIRQGDIFCGLPLIEINLREVDVVESDGITRRSWHEIARMGTDVVATLGVAPVTAIVITQDCDALHARDISLCQVKPFGDVDGDAKNAKDTKGWVRVITRQARLNLKWFYLPEDGALGFSDKRAADFFTVLRVSRENLMEYRSLRKRRLNEEAVCHFRERLAHFFRRYPYNEWYPLNAEEFSYYKQRYPDAEPYPWQGAVTGLSRGSAATGRHTGSAERSPSSPDDH